MHIIKQIVSRRSQNIYLSLLLCIFSIILTCNYVNNEQYIYTFDYSTYQEQATLVYKTIKESPEKLFALIMQSISWDYNLIFTIPLIPFLFLFGDSRLGFISSIVTAYNIPFCILVGVVISELYVSNKRIVFWISTFLAATIPIPWITTFRGWPDVGGSIFMGLSILVILRDFDLMKRWNIPKVGVFLGCALIFRRHFAYGARALILSLFVVYIADIALKKNAHISKKIKLLLPSLIKLGLILISCAAFVSITAWSLFQKLVFNNYRKLYESYESSLAENSFYYLQAYGLGILLMAFLGYLIYFLNSNSPKNQFRKLIFICTFFGISVFQWFFLARQIGVHYTNHFSIFIALGLSLFFVPIIHGFKTDLYCRILAVISSIFLLVNFQVTVSNTIQLPQNLSLLFSIHSPPLHRNDLDEAKKLIEFMKSVTRDNDVIYVAAATHTLNEATLNSGREQFYSDTVKFNIPQTASVDSRDFYPIESLIKAEYILLADPIQTPLLPEQKLIRFVLNQFQTKSKFSQDFERMNPVFKLENGVNVEIYHRIRPTSLEISIELLKMVMDFLPQKPGSQGDWLFVSSNRGSLTYAFSAREQSISVDVDTASSINGVNTLLYFGEISKKTHFTGQLIKDERCPGFRVEISTLKKNGLVINESNPIPYQIIQNLSLSVDVNGENSDYILWQFLPLDPSKRENYINFCSLSIHALKKT